MRIRLKNIEEIKKQDLLIDRVIREYKSFLIEVENWVFEQRGVHLVRPQLAYIALSVDKTWFKNRNKSKEELLILMCVAGVKAACEMLFIDIPDEIEIDETTLRVVR